MSTKINGKKPIVMARPYDELDALFLMYGREAVLKMFEDAMPKRTRDFGHMIVFGTGGDSFPVDEDLIKMFYVPQEYNIIQWIEKDL